MPTTPSPTPATPAPSAQPSSPGPAAYGDLSGRPDPDAPRRGPNLSYIPALDGVRAFAVLSVMAFHGGIGWMGGGFLGVDTFFVLSGFLITSLLIAEWERTSTIRLGAFWARRARRLLPALLLMLLFVAAFAAFVAPAGSYPDLRLDSLSALFYVANWHFILIGSNYFAQTGPVSPLTHTWSLAIEEQFYLVWPLVVLGVLYFTRRLGVLLGVCIGGAVASAAWMALLYAHGASFTRLDFGTDTHAQCLLVGATLAVTLIMVARRRRATGTVAHRARGSVGPGGDPAWTATGWAQPALVVAGAVGAAVTLLLWWKVSGQGRFVYQGGFFLAALCTAAVLASVVCVQGGALARALSVAPLRYVGRISYGMYLWHFPLFIWLDHERTGLSGPALFGARVAVTVAVASASFFLVERPIRQGTFLRDWRAWVATPAAAVAVVAALVAATAVPVAAVAPTARTPTADPALYRGPPIRVLIVGDSIALTLGLGLGVSSIDKAYNVDELDEGILGCGVAEGQQVELLGQVDTVSEACQPSAPADEQWPADWRGWIAQFHPNVVLFVAGRWEVADRTYNGQWTDILNPTFAAYVRGQLQKAVDVATSGGADMVMLTTPCFDSGEQPNGNPWPEDSAARLRAYNSLVRQVAAANAPRASSFDLDALVCPHGQFETDLGGVPVRSDDGVHFTVAGGEYLSKFVWPAVVAVGRRQLAGHT